MVEPLLIMVTTFTLESRMGNYLFFNPEGIHIANEHGYFGNF